MSRTYRKKEWVKYTEGRPTKDVPHICRCGSCTGIDRSKKKEKIADKEAKQLINQIISE